MRTIEILEEVLGNWVGIWRHTRLWRALRASDSTAHGCLRAYLEDVISPVDPSSLVASLIAEGEFEIAGELLENSGYLDDTGTIDVVSALNELTRRRIESQASILALADELVRRSQRAAFGLSVDDERFRLAYINATRDVAQAMSIMSTVEREVDEVESRLAEQLGRRLDEIRLLHTPSSKIESWQDALKSALDFRQFEVVQVLLEGGADCLMPASRDVRVPAFWPFRTKDAALLCKWSLESAGGPTEYYARWDPLKISQNARPLIEAIHSVCLEAHIPSEEELRGLINELARFLLRTDAESNPLLKVPGGFKTVVRGFDDRACPGIPKNGISFYFELDPEQLANTLKPSTDRGVVFSLRRDAKVIGTHAVITPWDLIRCLCPTSEARTELLRVICERLPADLFGSSAPDQWLLVGRAADCLAIRTRLVQSSLWLYGPRSVGKTAMISQVVSELKGERWRPCYVRDASEVAALVKGHATTEFVQGGVSVAAMTIAVLDGHMNIGTEDLSVLVSWVDECPNERRLLICTDVAGGQEATCGQSYLIDVLPFNTVRSVAEEILFMNGYRIANPVTIDKTAYYSAGRLSLFHVLISVLIAEREERGVPRSVPVTPKDVDMAARQRHYRNAATEILLGPIEADDSSHLVFAAIVLVYELYPDRWGLTGEFEIREVLEVLALEEVTLDQARLAKSIERLEVLGAIRTLPGQKLRLRPSGGAHIMLQIVGDRTDYLIKARTKWEKSTQVRAAGCNSLNESV